MIQITVTETDFFLPEDGPAAEQLFLGLLHSPQETWIAAYSLTLQPIFAEIKAADAAGVPVHLLLDHSQSTGRAEAALVKDLACSLRHGEVTITTAGVNSGAPSQIWHIKGMVVGGHGPRPILPGDCGEPYCWEGSVNFSDSGWKQGNSARLFQSARWAAAFLDLFDRHRNWAIVNEPQFQPEKSSVAVIVQA